MSAPRAVTPLLSRISHPAILPLPRRAAGNNVPHSMTKTRRIWRPNVGRHNLPVNVVGDAFAARTETDSVQQLRRVKMAARDIKTVDKNGGIEGTLLSRPPSKLTPYGRKLRAELFDSLHALRRDLQAKS